MPRKRGQKIVAGSTPITESRCNICQSASRPKVDKLIASQFSFVSIAEELIESDPEFKDKSVDTVRKNVERHAKRHLDIRNRAIRRMVEQRAREQGILLDSVEGKITSGRALLDVLIAKATEQASDPNSKVRYADAIEAVKMLEDVQKAEYQHQLEVMQRQVWAISQAVKNKVPAALLPAIVKEAKELFDGTGEMITVPTQPELTRTTS
jgi:hypothetical protein